MCQSTTHTHTQLCHFFDFDQTVFIIWTFKLYLLPTWSPTCQLCHSTGTVTHGHPVQFKIQQIKTASPTVWCYCTVRVTDRTWAAAHFGGETEQSWLSSTSQDRQEQAEPQTIQKDSTFCFSPLILHKHTPVTAISMTDPNRLLQNIRLYWEIWFTGWAMNEWVVERDAPQLRVIFR